jgi:cell division protein FtsB
MASTLIWFAVIIVVTVIIFFVIALFTKINNKLLTAMLIGFLLFWFVVTAGYAADAAAKTGGKNVDDANRQAHENYTIAATIAWIIVGLTILGLIGAVVFLFLGGGETAVAGEVAAGGAEAALAAGASETAVAGAVATELEAIGGEEITALASKLNKEKGGGLFDSGGKDEGLISKLIKGLEYIVLFGTIILAIVVGSFLANGARIQGESEYKEGWKKAIVGATISLFIAGSFILLFIAVFIKQGITKKKLKEDIKKAEQLTQERRAEVMQIKGQYVNQILQKKLERPVISVAPSRPVVQPTLNVSTGQIVQPTQGPLFTPPPQPILNPAPAA